MAMLGTCFAIVGLFDPYWIGAVGAIAATAAGRFTPQLLGILDDNWVIVGESLEMMAAMTTSVGWQ